MSAASKHKNHAHRVCHGCHPGVPAVHRAWPHYISIEDVSALIALELSNIVSDLLGINTLHKTPAWSLSDSESTKQGN